ncbi:MAG: glycosyltransferase family 2 protein [Gemmatimonadales bacterium]|nr:glycosyltransferase family 2 protein [Gemmatimonadales bacterium]
MVKVSGFTIVRNAIKLDFPVEASIRSILPICDEVVVNVGRSEDDTLDLVRSIGDSRIRILETEWDMSRRNAVLGRETHRAMQACTHPWGVYIQADEVLHERGREQLASAIQAADGDPRIEGLLVKYLHFYGGFDTVATHRRWYRREVRAVRLAAELDIRPYQGAQGFRVGPKYRRIRARLTGAEMFHYGWARPAQALREKRDLGRTMYPWRDADVNLPLLAWMPGLERFQGTHPAVARPWIEDRYFDPDRVIAPRKFRWRFIRYYLSTAIERHTGIRVFEFRNYKTV